MSPTEKTLTEREAVLRERRAFDVGVEWQYRHFDACRRRAVEAGGPVPINSLDVFAKKEEAKIRYPLPRVIRSRVVKVDGDLWRVVEGRVEWSSDSAFWYPVGSVSRHITQTRLEILADLLANPTEEVDDVGGAS